LGEESLRDGAKVLFSARMSEASKFDPHRRLCPDGACIGVIGDDGRCRVCGRSGSGSGKDSAPAGFVPAGGDDDDNLDAGDDADVPAAAEAGAPAGSGAFDPNRRLCPDGSCLGVLGADGVCNVCGQKGG
jgi:hypothetical protein